MTTFAWITLMVFSAATLVVFVMLGRLGALLDPARHRKRPRIVDACTMIAVIGVWEMSVGALLIALHSYDSALSPGLLGVLMVAGRFVVPALTKRSSQGV